MIGILREAVRRSMCDLRNACPTRDCPILDHRSRALLVVTGTGHDRVSTASRPSTSSPEERHWLQKPMSARSACGAVASRQICRGRPTGSAAAAYSRAAEVWISHENMLRALIEEKSDIHSDQPGVDSSPVVPREPR